MLGPNLATCQLAARDENAVKLELKLSDENGRRKQTKTRWGWGGKHNRNDMESVNKGSSFHTVHPGQPYTTSLLVQSLFEPLMPR